MNKIVTITKRYQPAIPTNMRAGLLGDKGFMVEVETVPEGLLIKPLKKPFLSEAGSLKKYLVGMKKPLVLDKMRDNVNFAR